MTEQNTNNENVEAEIAGDATDTDEQDNYIICELEDGTKEEFYVDDVLSIEIDGEERDYAILVPKAEKEAVDNGEKDEVEELIIARWITVENNGGIEILPITDAAEEKLVEEAVTEFYREQEEAEEAEATAAANAALADAEGNTPAQ